LRRLATNSSWRSRPLADELDLVAGDFAGVFDADVLLLELQHLDERDLIPLTLPSVMRSRLSR